MLETRSAPIVANPDLLEMEYAVRGPIPRRAAQLRAQGRTIIPCNIGNPQALGQAPISYYRQVLALLEEPDRIERERRLNACRTSLPNMADEDFVADDVLGHCQWMLDRLETGMGAYTESNGARFVREAVAAFIDRRDGRGPGDALAANPDHIFLTGGASVAVRHLIDQLIAGPRDGIMIPIPQYPLYSASIRKAGGVQVDYYPEEESGWRFDAETLEEAAAGAEREGVCLKAIVVINPGNPTGAILDEPTIEGILDFAERRGLVVIADEVYQENVYGGQFHAFAKVLGDRPVALASLHSVSKGFVGECGHRGGYVELRNPAPIEGSEVDMAGLLFEQASVELCANTSGQILTYLMVRPPEPGSSAYPRYRAEREAILADLEAKAEMIRQGFAQMEGLRCFGRSGAMYLFPRLDRLPAGRTDFDYCMALLEETGLVTVNGSGFGQQPGTQHLRIAFLPPIEQIRQVQPDWIEFHRRYLTAGSG